MKKVKIGLIVFAVIIIIADFTLIDYSKLGGTKNIGAYCGIFAMAGVIISTVMQMRADNKQQRGSSDKNS